MNGWRDDSDFEDVASRIIAMVESEVRRLRELSFELQKPEDYNPKVVSVKYESGKLLFELDQTIVGDWFQIIAYGSYSHSAIMGYETQRLQKYDRNIMAMPMRVDEQKSTIKSVVGHVNDWIVTANGLYKNQLIHQLESQQREKEQNRRAEISRLEKANDMNEFLSSLQ